MIFFQLERGSQSVFLVSLFKKTVLLDLKDVNYLWCGHPRIGEQAKYYPKRGILLECMKVIYRMSRALLFSVKHRGQPARSGSILFFVDSVNQYRVLKPVKELLAEGKFWVDCKDFRSEVYFPAWQARVAGVLFFPLFLLRAFEKGFPRWTLSYSLAEYIDAYGYFFVGSIALKRAQPKGLVLSNDHCTQTRALRLACEWLEIPTVYIPHATVTEDFPALDFDLALLDGNDSAQKYDLSKNTCRIYLVGSTKRNLSKRPEQTSKTMNVALAFNISDSEQNIEYLVNELQSYFPRATLSIRPHPADLERLEFFRQFSTKMGARYSDPMKETSFEFACGHHFLVAGHSCILLDAAFLGVVPIQHERLVEGADAYGFRAHGVVTVIESMSELSGHFANYAELQNKLSAAVRNYDVTYRTCYDGQSAKLAAMVIEKEILKRSNSTPSIYPNADEFGVFQPAF